MLTLIDVVGAILVGLCLIYAWLNYIGVKEKEELSTRLQDAYDNRNTSPAMIGLASQLEQELYSGKEPSDCPAYLEMQNKYSSKPKKKSKAKKKPTKKPKKTKRK